MKTLLATTLVLGIASGTGTADPAQSTQAPNRKIECYCTDTAGARREMGDEICLFVDGRAFMARCEMSLNNPMWREQAEGCPGASLVNDDIGNISRILLE